MTNRELTVLNIGFVLGDSMRVLGELKGRYFNIQQYDLSEPITELEENLVKLRELHRKFFDEINDCQHVACIRDSCYRCCACGKQLP